MKRCGSSNVLQGIVQDEFNGVDRDAVHDAVRPAGRNARLETGAVLQETPGVHAERPERRQSRHRRVQVPVPHAPLELLDAGRGPPPAHHRPAAAAAVLHLQAKTQG